MSFPVGLDEARAYINRVQPDNPTAGETSKILSGSENGGGMGEAMGMTLKAKHFTLKKSHDGGMRRDLVPK
jgi:hypothetical protein